MTSVKPTVRNYLIVSALLPVVLLWNPPPGPKAPVCTSSECKTRGSMYLKNMHSPGNPCINFYEFACGGWSKKNPTPAYLQEWSVLTRMHRETLEQLLTVFKKSVKRDDSPGLQRAKRIFNVCVNIPSLGRGDAAFLVKNMDKIGRYPETSVWDLHHGYVKLTRESPLFDIQIMADREHNDEPLLQFKHIKSPFGSITRVRPWNSDQTEAYLRFLVNLMKSVRSRKQPAFNENAITKIIKDVIDFRFKLNQISRKSRFLQPPPTRPVTPRALQQWYNSHSKTKRSEINWATIVSNLYSGLPDTALRDNPKVGIRDENYFIALAGLLAETSEETLAYHYDIYFMERHYAFPTTALEGLQKLVSKMNGYTGYVRKEEMAKSLQCVDDINMDEVKGRLYVANYFQKKNIPLVEDILEELRDAIKRDIMDSKWPDKETKVASIRRITDINWRIGYPPWYDNPSIKPDSSLVQPASINAHLAIEANRISISAAFMQSPVFDPRVPEVINYGAIGTTMGHEMYHALDDCGKFRNNKGEVKTWWSNPMQQKCQIRKKCFIEEYTKLTTKELETLRLPSVTPELLPKMSDASNTFLEDVADAMGLEAAYHAYQARLKKQKNACAVLPNFERYSCEQMFFISFANTLCGYQVPEGAFSLGRIYSPLRLRVNAAVSNNADFSQVFGCTNSNPMNPQKKCNMWV